MQPELIGLLILGALALGAFLWAEFGPKAKAEVKSAEQNLRTFPQAVVTDVARDAQTAKRVAESKISEAETVAKEKVAAVETGILGQLNKL